jgi:chromosome segregation ATPase
MPLLSIAQELKSKSEAWQKVIAANQAVDEITGPVLNEFDKLEKNRRNLQTQIGRADQIVPEKLAWPPTTQRLTMERDKFKKLEEQYNSFKKTRHKAIQLVSIISDLSDQYRELHGEVTRILDQASQDQKRFTDLERRLHQSKAMWNSRLAENRTNAILVDEIEELLENIDRDYQELQKRVMSGSLPFQQALQMFRVLCRKLDEAAVQAGANQIMDITGQIHRQL